VSGCCGHGECRSLADGHGLADPAALWMVMTEEPFTVRVAEAALVTLPAELVTITSNVASVVRCNRRRGRVGGQSCSRDVRIVFLPLVAQRGCSGSDHRKRSS